MNVRRARIRLTILFLTIFAVVIGLFSIVFYIAFALVLRPDFDIDPELTSAQVVEATYAATIERIGVALIVADAVVLLVVAFVAWVMARRTLEPIRDAHVRQQRFVADASHETKNPLAAIKATTSSALGAERSPEELRAALETVDVTVDRLIRLTGDLLVIARSNDPLAPTTRVPSDLSVIVSEALVGVVPASGSGDVATNLEPDLPVLVDPDEVGRIARNLVENAFRYGGPGVKVTVRTWASGGDVNLEVRDDGPGIAPADLDRVFDPFYRSAAWSRDRDGIGLGLSIARDLAQRNGGRLTVASSLGSGATFLLVLRRHR